MPSGISDTPIVALSLTASLSLGSTFVHRLRPAPLLVGSGLHSRTDPSLPHHFLPSTPSRARILYSYTALDPLKQLNQPWTLSMGSSASSPVAVVPGTSLPNETLLYRALTAD